MHAIVHDPITSPSELRADLPKALDAIVLKALDRDPTRRYATAAALRADLEQLISSAGARGGSRDLAAFMLTVFGHERMRRIVSGNDDTGADRLLA